MKTVFTTGEAAKICKVSQQTIIRCFDSGQLKGFRVPGSRFRRIPRDQLFHFMRDNGIPTDALESGKRKVLLVDDDQELVELITDLLERDGRFEVRTANNGFDAGMMVKEYRPDLIVLDVMLPDINGKEVCQRVRSDNTMDEVRIICISGMVEEDKIDDLRAAGANDFLHKPFEVEALIDRMCQLLDLETATPARYSERMLWLPELIESGVCWRLPLSLGAAPALAAALVGEPNEPTVAALGEALAEPSLSVWTVHRAWALGCAEIRTVASAAEWLARHAQTVLDWGDAGSLTDHDEALADAYGRLTEKSVQVAARARDCAVRHGGLGDEPARHAEEARFLGLLHASERWWKLAARQPSDAVAVLPAVPRPPPWLAEALGHLTLEPGDSSPSAAAGATEFVKTARQTASYQGELGSGSRLEVDPPASLGALALAASLPSLSALARRRPYDADELEAAKLEAMAEFAAGAGHEINNPLAVIAGRAQLLLDGEPNGQRRRELAVIHSQAMRVHEMIADMMLFARPPKPKAGACDLPRVLREVASEMTARAAERNVEVSLELPDEVGPVTADATQLAAAVRAICENALAAVDRGGRIGLRLERPAENSSEVRTVAIVVTDNGSGIPAEVRPHIFDPFYCGRHAGRGLGMGLAKAWRIVRNHDGRIEVDSAPGLGSTFRIVLPAV